MQDGQKSGALTWEATAVAMIVIAGTVMVIVGIAVMVIAAGWIAMVMPTASSTALSQVLTISLTLLIPSWMPLLIQSERQSEG